MEMRKYGYGLMLVLLAGSLLTSTAAMSMPTGNPISSNPEEKTEAQSLKKAAIVIDDFGNQMSGTEEMMELPVPFTAAIMPFLPTTKQDAELAHSHGKDVIVHMPMEPVKGKKSWLGPGALLWFLNVGGVYIGVVWAVTVYCFYMVRRRYPRMASPYRVRLGWVPAVGALAGVVVILGGLVPGLPLSLVWPYEYAIIGVWLVAGLVLYRLAPRTHSRDEALKALLGDHYDALDGDLEDRGGREPAAEASVALGR